MSESTLQETFQRGVRAARRGRNEAAQRLLKEVVAADPQHEQAWLWLARVTDDPAEKTTCLERVIALNPDNQWDGTVEYDADLTTVVSSTAQPNFGVAGGARDAREVQLGLKLTF